MNRTERDGTRLVREKREKARAGSGRVRPSPRFVSGEATRTSATVIAEVDAPTPEASRADISNTESPASRLRAVIDRLHGRRSVGRRNV